MGNKQPEVKLEDSEDYKIFQKAYGHKFKKEEYSANRPFLIFLIGPSQSGKSSFLKMLLRCENGCKQCSDPRCVGESLCVTCMSKLCSVCKQSKMVAIGNGVLSCTSNFKTYDVTHPSMFGKRGAKIVDTVGFGDTSGELSDLTILSLLHCKLMESASTVQMAIDAVFFFQSCKSLLTLKPLLLDIELLIGERASEHSAIFLTKRNAINDDDPLTFEELHATVHGILKDLGKDIPVIDLYTPYYHRRQNKLMAPDDVKMQTQLSEISRFIKSKPAQGIDMYDEWEKVRLEVFKIYTDLKKKKENERFGELYEVYDKEYKKKGFFEKIFSSSKSTTEIRSEAVTSINELYANKGHLARKATELVIFDRIHNRKDEKQNAKEASHETKEK